MNASQNKLAATAFVVSIAAVIGLVFAVGSHMATAQTEPPAPEATEDNSPDLDSPPHPISAPKEGIVHRPARDFFTPYPADDGAQSWEDLNSVEQAAIERMEEVYEADHAPSVHAAYSRGTASRVAYAKLRAAERVAGLENIDELGVE